MAYVTFEGLKIMATKSANTKKTSAPKAKKVSTSKATAPVSGFTEFSKNNVVYGFTVALIAINGSADLTTRAASFLKDVLTSTNASTHFQW
jgi:hypothetical protein